MVTGTARPAVCLVMGHSGGGKTTLVERLVAELTKRGYVVATAKGHKEPIETDVPGKDTWRHRRAGAKLTFLVSAYETAAFMDRELGADPDALALLCPPSIDLLIAEGFKTHTGRPKIAVSPRFDAEADPDVICVVSDEIASLKRLPLFKRDDVMEITDFLVEKVLKR